ncbi:MFS transporter, partial [Tsukamurella sp. NPDC003166]|uniref:MFS transporter n=1 Tax=Tsukamurella sp. NPDC003166 TaxID=3154444 RepID=UPI0033BD987A
VHVRSKLPLHAVPGSRLIPAEVTLNDGARPPMPPLLIAVAGICLACIAATAMSAFTTTWAVELGMSEHRAATAAGVGSLLSVVARVATGVLADRRGRAHLPAAAIQVAVGAVALAVLSVPHLAAFWPGMLVAFSIGWAWPGLLILAMMRLARDSPGTVSGLVQGGMFLGGALGPSLFGATVAAAGFTVAWLAAAAVMAAGAALLLVARRAFLRHPDGATAPTAAASPAA